MTITDAAALKACLGDHLHAVRRGETIIVMDHVLAIARMVPVEDERAASTLALPGFALETNDTAEGVGVARARLTGCGFSSFQTSPMAS